MRARLIKKEGKICERGKEGKEGRKKGRKMTEACNKNKTEMQNGMKI